jgi:hypothetical protein
MRARFRTVWLTKLQIYTRSRDLRDRGDRPAQQASPVGLGLLVSAVLLAVEDHAAQMAFVACKALVEKSDLWD